MEQGSGANFARGPLKGRQAQGEPATKGAAPPAQPYRALKQARAEAAVAAASWRVWAACRAELRRVLAFLPTHAAELPPRQAPAQMRVWLGGGGMRAGQRASRKEGAPELLAARKLLMPPQPALSSKFS